MKRKLFSVILGTALTASLLAGCGSKEEAAQTTAAPAAETTAAEAGDTEAAAEEGDSSAGSSYEFTTFV